MHASSCLPRKNTLHFPARLNMFSSCNVLGIFGFEVKPAPQINVISRLYYFASLAFPSQRPCTRRIFFRLLWSAKATLPPWPFPVNAPAHDPISFGCFRLRRVAGDRPCRSPALSPLYICIFFCHHFKPELTAFLPVTPTRGRTGDLLSLPSSCGTFASDF